MLKSFEISNSFKFRKCERLSFSFYFLLSYLCPRILCWFYLSLPCHSDNGRVPLSHAILIGETGGVDTLDPRHLDLFCSTHTKMEATTSGHQPLRGLQTLQRSIYLFTYLNFSLQNVFRKMNRCNPSRFKRVTKKLANYVSFLHRYNFHTFIFQLS